MVVLEEFLKKYIQKGLKRKKKACKTLEFKI